MISHKYFITSILVLYAFSSSAQDKLVRDLGKFYKNIKVVKYKFIAKEKSYDEKDTVVLHGQVIQQFIPQDSNLFVNYKIITEDGNIYVKNQLERFAYVKQYNSFNRSSGSLGIRSVEESFALNDNFFRAISTAADSDNENYPLYEKDTIVNNKPCFKLTQKVEFSNFDGSISVTFFIHHKSNKIVLSKSTLNLGSLVRYNEMNFISIEFLDTINADTFSRKAYGTHLGVPVSLDSFRKIDDDKSVSLKIGNSIKSILGKSNNKAFTIDSLNTLSAITVVDLWYMACPPCIKSIPVLNELHDKYSQKGVRVVGVNNRDYYKDSGIINSFIRKKEVKYEILLVDNENFKPIATSIFPTLLIIDKNGIIRYIKTGYYDDMKILVENELDLLLKE